MYLSPSNEAPLGLIALNHPTHKSLQTRLLLVSYEMYLLRQFIFNIWPFATMKICPIAKKLPNLITLFAICR